MANKKVSQLTSKPSVLTTDLFPIADPSTGQLFKTTISDLGTAIGSGVSSVNSLVGAVVLDTDDIQELASPTNRWFTDTRARAALSASSPLTYNSGTGVFSIPAATSTINGYLSSTDWTTFNAKQAALSGTGFVKILGTTISYDNSTYLTTSAAASTYLMLGGGTLTGALLGTSAGFTGYVGIGNTSPLYQLDVTGSGRFEGDLRIESTNPRIYLTDTDNNPDYFISNTDGTFTIYDVTNSASRLTISSSQISPRLPIVSNSSIQGTAFYSDSFFSATTFVTANNYFLTGMTAGSGALYYNSGANRVTVANYNASGVVSFEVNGGSTALTLNSNLSATFASTLSATGATLTGALSGTSATFSGEIQTTQGIYINRASLPYIQFAQSGTAFGQIRGNGTTFGLTDANGSTYYLGLNASTGAATFSSSVTAQAIYATDATGSAILTTNGGGEGILSVNTANPLRMLINGGEKMRITSSGFVLIGSTAADPVSSNVAGISFEGSLGSGKFSRLNNACLDVNRVGGTDGEVVRMYKTGTQVGNISVTSSSTSYNTSSDYRLKEDLKSINGLEIVNKIKVYDYKWKAEDRRMDGVLAHELAEVLPYAVTGVKDGEQMQSVDYSKIVPVMVQAIKELKAELDTLKNK